MNLLFTIDHNYLAALRVCLKSILRFPAQGGYDVYFLHSDLTKEDFDALDREFGTLGATFYGIEVDPLRFSAFPESGRYPQTMYYRIFAAQFLPERLERVLYLDPDLIALKPLDDLYHTDFEGALYCACTHVREFLTRVNQHRLGMAECAPYINTGVLLMNLAALRSEQNEQEVIEYARDRGQWFTLPDQDVLTALYGSRVKLMDTMLYNLSDRVLALYNIDLRNEKRGLDWVKDHTVIVHYCGANKPWKKNYIGLLDCFYHEIAEGR